MADLAPRPERLRTPAVPEVAPSARLRSLEPSLTEGSVHKTRCPSRMNRRKFLITSMAGTVVEPLAAVSSASPSSAAAATSTAPVQGQSRVAVLPIDIDRVTTPIDERIYGQFLVHINHSVEDGLFAEQIRGAGFDGDDFKTYWESFPDRGRVEIAEIDFQNGKKSVRLTVEGVRAGIRQGRLFLDRGLKYDGSLWAKREQGSPELTARVRTSEGRAIASMPLALTSSEWQEIPLSFSSPVRDTQAGTPG
jgi:alpha-N-arabinofuranosidase